MIQANMRSFYWLRVNRSLAAFSISFFLVLTTWLILSSTGSIFYTGLIASITAAISVLLSPIAGHVVDKMNRRKLLIVISLLELAAYSVFLLLLIIQLPFYLYYAVIAVVYFLEIQAGMLSFAMTPQLVDEKKLVFANSLTEISLTVSEFLGPVMAGVMVSVISGYSASIFVLVIVLVIASIFAFMVPRGGDLLSESLNNEEAQPELKGWKAALHFARSNFAAVILFSTTLSSFLVVLDVLGAPLIRIVDHGSLIYYGLFVGFYSLGGFLGAFLPPVLKVKRIGKLVLLYFLTSGVALILMALVPQVLLDLLLIFLIGFIASITNVPLMAFLQKSIPSEIIGKVTSIMDISRMSLAPVAAFVMAASGSEYGVISLFLVSGISILFLCLIIPLTKVMKIEVSA